MLESSEKSVPAVHGLSKNLKSITHHPGHFSLLIAVEEEELEKNASGSEWAQKWPLSLPATACWREVNSSTSLTALSQRGDPDPSASW